MKTKRYLVATIRPWNVRAYHEIISRFPGEWRLVTDVGELTPEGVKTYGPRYIFFPHWSTRVPKEILTLAECVCFHETDVPYGRGGSPIQNLIARGHRETVISALRMVEELDAGPVYLKRPLSLEGRAQEIFERASLIVAEMIMEIVTTEPKPKPQMGEAVVFRRRRPDQSRIPENLAELEALYDHVRMLDADEYPRAVLEQGGFRFEFSVPVMKGNEMEAVVKIVRRRATDEGEKHA